MDDFTVKIDEIYVPARLRAALDPEKVDTLAESILELGQQTPISVRHDGERYILVAGMHRMEACKALGEETMTAILVRAIQH
jgi:ParB/RepB/Spo0J family partition protein